MSKYLYLILMMISAPAFANVDDPSNAPQVPVLLGTTLQQGDISSGGDQSMTAEEPDMVAEITKNIAQHTLINCMIAAKNYSVEFSEAFSSWENRGAVRMMKPGEAGGGVTTYLEAYTSATQIDPVANMISINMSSHSVDTKGVTVSNLILQLQVGTKNNKLEIIAADYFYNSPTENLFGTMDKKEITCSFGQLKTMWD